MTKKYIIKITELDDDRCFMFVSSYWEDINITLSRTEEGACAFENESEAEESLAELKDNWGMFFEFEVVETKGAEQ